MPIGSDFYEQPAPADAAEATVGMVMSELIAAAKAGRVVYLTGPADDDAPAAAVVPVEVAKAGLAALSRNADGTPA